MIKQIFLIYKWWFEAKGFDEGTLLRRAGPKGSSWR
tara:strand:- start:1 stop:108 length:108 start_codon:yes stop_codon:yes gene_type:complete